MNSLGQWNSAQSACFARVLLAGFSPTQRLELRRQKAQPIVEALKGRVESARASALPRSALGKACDYSLAAGAATTVSGLCEIELSNNLPNLRVLGFFRAHFGAFVAREASILQHRDLENGNYSH